MVRSQGCLCVRYLGTYSIFVWTLSPALVRRKGRAVRPLDACSRRDLCPFDHSLTLWLASLTPTKLHRRPKVVPYLTVYLEGTPYLIQTVNFNLSPHTIPSFSYISGRLSLSLLSFAIVIPYNITGSHVGSHSFKRYTLIDQLVTHTSNPPCSTSSCSHALLFARQSLLEPLSPRHIPIAIPSTLPIVHQTLLSVPLPPSTLPTTPRLTLTSGMQHRELSITSKMEENSPSVREATRLPFSPTSTSSLVVSPLS